MRSQNLPPLPSEEFWQDYNWANQHYGDLLKSYPNQWVGVHHKQVIAAGQNLDKVEGALDTKFPGKDIPLLFVSDATHIY